MLLLGVLGAHVREHLDLVELVHPDDAPGVLAVRARLAAEARRPARVTQRQLVGVEDLLGVVAGQRHLGGADEVEVVLGEAVDLLVVGHVEAGALHGLRLDEHRRDHRREPGLDRLLHGHVEQAELQPRADALEEEEARARDLGAPLHVDGAKGLAQLQVVLRLEVERAGLAVRLEHDVVVLAAVRGRLLDDVRHRLEQVVQLRAQLLGLGLGGLDLAREVLGPLEQRGLLLALRLGDRLAHALLLGAQRLERGQRGSAALVEVEQRVDDRVVLTAGTLRRP
ncbi:hypothetical protein GCM10020220_054520 [Nonomuraea rubra]